MMSAKTDTSSRKKLASLGVNSGSNPGDIAALQRAFDGKRRPEQSDAPEASSS